MPASFDVHDQAAFDALQAKLVPLWTSLRELNQDEQTIVVVPSAATSVPLLCGSVVPSARRIR